MGFSSTQPVAIPERVPERVEVPSNSRPLPKPQSGRRKFSITLVGGVPT